MKNGETHDSFNEEWQKHGPRYSDASSQSSSLQRSAEGNDRPGVVATFFMVVFVSLILTAPGCYFLYRAFLNEWLSLSLIFGMVLVCSGLGLSWVLGRK